jgi:hypothetical protein
VSVFGKSSPVWRPGNITTLEVCLSVCLARQATVFHSRRGATNNWLHRAEICSESLCEVRAYRTAVKWLVSHPEAKMYFYVGDYNCDKWKARPSVRQGIMSLRGDWHQGRLAVCGNETLTSNSRKLVWVWNMHLESRYLATTNKVIDLLLFLFPTLFAICTSAFSKCCKVVYNGMYL